MSLFLFDLFVVPNGWCSKLCPLGGFYSLFSKISLVNIRYYENNCTACMKCKDVCPIKHVLFMVAKSDIDENIVKSGDCINCGRCIEVCDDDALSFSILNIKDKK